jgi:dihydrodipicolinate synthase/N-acetylneuraminate lyase
VIVHCGAQTTAETTALAAHAGEAGAAGVAVIAPPYFRFDEDELLEHFAAAAAACSPLPFYVYEFADRSGYAVGVAVSGVAAAFPEHVSALVRDPTPEQAALVESLRTTLSRHRFQASVKVALALRDVPVLPDVRAPLRPLSGSDARRLRAELESVIGLGTRG